MYQLLQSNNSFRAKFQDYFRAKNKQWRDQKCDPRLNTDGPLAPAMEIGQRPGESVPF